MAIRIEAAAFPADAESAARLFRAYAASLEVDLGFQGFAAELASLPGAYAPPAGGILLARGPSGEALGCVALRPIPPDGRCEMKRLYVAPSARRLGAGRALVDAAVARASAIGYREMRLDTLESMRGARALYQAAGFEPVAPYYDTPLAGTIFLGRRLGTA